MPRMKYKTLIRHLYFRYIYINHQKSFFLFNGCGFENTIKLYKNSDLKIDRIELIIVLFLYSIFNCLFTKKIKCLELQLPGLAKKEKHSERSTRLALSPDPPKILMEHLIY